MKHVVREFTRILGSLIGSSPRLVEAISNAMLIRPYFLFAMFVEVNNASPRKDYLTSCKSKLISEDI